MGSSDEHTAVTHRSRFTSILLFLVSAGAAFTATKKADKPVVFDVPFASQTRGIAGGPTLGIIFLKPGSEGLAVSRSVLDALQSLQFSLTATNINPADGLPADRENTFDIVPVGDDLLKAYNAAEPRLKLPIDRQYGLQYSLRYSIREGSLHYELRSVLFQRGLASAGWTQFTKDYSGQFFSEYLRKKIIEELQMSSPNTPATK